MTIPTTITDIDVPRHADLLAYLILQLVGTVAKLATCTATKAGANVRIVIPRIGRVNKKI
jgi:hypothetical protein